MSSYEALMRTTVTRTSIILNCTIFQFLIYRNCTTLKIILRFKILKQDRYFNHTFIQKIYIYVANKTLHYCKILIALIYSKASCKKPGSNYTIFAIKRFFVIKPSPLQPVRCNLPSTLFRLETAGALP